jgi:hypothetical protein
VAAGRSADHPEAGRIILREGRAQAIIEVPDIKLRQLGARVGGGLTLMEKLEWFVIRGIVFSLGP